MTAQASLWSDRLSIIPVVESASFCPKSKPVALFISGNGVSLLPCPIGTASSIELEILLLVNQYLLLSSVLNHGPRISFARGIDLSEVGAHDTKTNSRQFCICIPLFKLCEDLLYSKWTVD